MSMNIAIDGPAGAGKSTIAKKLAKKLAFVYGGIREQCTVRWHTIFYRTALHQMMSRRLRQPARRLT